MTRWLREFRLMPVVLIAVGCLFALKTIGLIFDGGYTLGQRLGSSDTLVVTRVPVPPTQELHSTTSPLEIASAQPRGSKHSWMQEMFNYPGGGDITGSIHTTKPAEKEALEKAQAEKPKSTAVDPPAAEIKAAGGKVIAMKQQSASPAERALLERLQARRQELDARARELDLRETCSRPRNRSWRLRPFPPRRAEPKPAGRLSARKTPKQPASKLWSPCTRP